LVFRGLDAVSELLLLSGGLDSAALAALRRPDTCLTIDYGQVSARGEIAASTAICGELALIHRTITVAAHELGAGLLAGEDRPTDQRPSPEWWPFRNQMLATFGAAWAVMNEHDLVTIGSVATDGERHVDGRADFYDRLDALVAMQEGRVHIEAPAVHSTTIELIEAAQLSDSVLGWTHSCHTSAIACGQCPGCEKRLAVLERLGRLQDVDRG
jgi:7-cyano-7-deazaguanine synthase